MKPKKVNNILKSLEEEQNKNDKLQKENEELRKDNKERKKIIKNMCKTLDNFYMINKDVVL